MTPDLTSTRTVKVNGKELTVSREGSLSPVRSWAWRSERGHLLALINYDPEGAHAVRLAAPDIARARAVFGPSPRVDADGVVIELKPYEFAALTW